MPIPEFLNGFDPEMRLISPDLPTDKLRDPYLPVTHPVAAKKVLPDDSQPGRYVMAHIVDGNRGPISEKVRSMLDEGIISPRRYAIFSASPTFSWGLIDEPATQVVCRSPHRWSREGMDDGDNYISPWFEGMIGLTIPEAAQIAPRGTSFWVEDRERKRKIEKTYVFSFVPPPHIIGLIKLTDQTHGPYRNSIQVLDAELMTGDRSEGDCIGDFVQRNSASVEIDAIAPETKESLLQALAAAYTQNRVLVEIGKRLGETSTYDLRRVRPSFPWTTELLETAIKNLYR